MNFPPSEFSTVITCEILCQVGKGSHQAFLNPIPYVFTKQKKIIFDNLFSTYPTPFLLMYDITIFYETSKKLYFSAVTIHSAKGFNFRKHQLPIPLSFSLSLKSLARATQDGHRNFQDHV